MILALIVLAQIAAVASLSLIGIGIGRFYRMKFGESTHCWLLGVGAGLGVLGQILTFIPGLPPGVADLVYVPGALTLAVGVFWLWFVMMGPRR